jgi:putative copper resistance protein D
MQMLMTLVRAVHYASFLSLAGALAFAVVVAEPALRRHGDDGGASGLRRRLAALAWGGLALGLLSGLLWLVIEAQNMSGKPFAEVLAQGVLGVVLTRTRFGNDWALRGLLAIPLILSLLPGLGQRSAAATIGRWAALALAAAELALIAGAGHAIAGTGWTGDLHLIGDGAHLLAAGAWVGGLVPLALLFAAARRDPGSACARAARDATRRFSVIGVIAVGTLLITGLINSVFLVGSVPALLGTDYGHLLMVKIALFLTMVVFAAINRQWLLPQLAAARGDVLCQLQRNALIEAGLGGAVLLVIGLLGTTPPALHVQPEWPLPFSLSLDALEANPGAQIQAIVSAIIALGGLVLMGYGLLQARRRTPQILLGLFLFIAVGAWPLQFMVVTAYPTSFYRSAVPLGVGSILRGERLYAENCVACHGAQGHGDGPLAKSMPVKPADLTAAHIFEHNDGDLFWWISSGIVAGGMPGFAPALDERARWDLINFIHARAAGAQPGALRAEVTAGPAPPAPNFAFEQKGRQSSLQQRLQQGPLLLIFYRLPQSAPHLQQLAAAEQRLSAAGLHLLALPLAADEEPPDPLPDFAATADADAADAYRLFMPAGALAPSEFLIDGAGFLRARWTVASAADMTTLEAQLARLAALPLQRESHVHAH